MNNSHVRWLIGTWSVVLILLIIVVWLASGWVVRRAHGHESWISKNRLTDPASGEWCCSSNDCQPEKVTEVIGGYRTQAGDVVPYSRVIWQSPDGLAWRCRYLSGPQKNQTRCLILPPPGS